uniref:Rapid alkalinization factor-like n=1 Tax=Kalanchoe fedtschenkoi TaxID=63787 RepID=A0A7N1A235_KALFE
MAQAAVRVAVLIVLVIASTSSLLVSSSSAGDLPAAAQLFSWMPSRSTCQGTIAECLADEDGEFDLDSESNRRILATSNYISYGALSRNRVPCSRRGASYYNCQAGAQANPYSRGCSAITRCRS